MNKLKLELDKLMSEYVLLRDPYCVICGRPTTDPHHICGRGNAVRWNRTCVKGVCRDCHRGLHDKPAFAKTIFRLMLGKETYDFCVWLGTQPKPMTDKEMQEQKELLTKLIKEGQDV